MSVVSVDERIDIDSKLNKSYSHDIILRRLFEGLQKSSSISTCGAFSVTARYFDQFVEVCFGQ